MKTIRRTLFFAILLLSSAMLASCADYTKCGLGGCAEDKATTAQVQSLFGEHDVLRGQTDINIQTIDHVVYLSGLVDTQPMSDLAERVAHEASGVIQVVNSINVRNGRN